MKITCGKREDIIKQRDEYDAAADAQQKQHDAEYRAFRQKEHDVCEGVAQIVRSKLAGPAAHINLEVSAEPRWVFTRRHADDLMSIEVSVKSNEGWERDADTALRWSWSVRLGEGFEVVKESNSWSGLQATKPEHLDHLKWSLAALEILMNIDWVEVLNKELPNIRDYIKTRSPSSSDRPNFEQQLLEVDIEEAIAKGQLIQGTGLNGKGSMWYLILKETPKQYVVAYIWSHYLEQEYLDQYFEGSVAKLVEQNKKYTDRVSKEKFFSLIAKPLVTKEVE